MYPVRSTRRGFLKQAGLLGSFSLLGWPRLAPVRSAGQPADAGLLVRPNIASLDPEGPEIAALRRGVRAMQNRPANDPTSWTYQANIHGTYDTPAMPGWGQCQHGCFFFLSWHRLYLYFFERILRAASGEPSLTLPYWDYANPTQRALPVAFRQPADASNPLYVAERNTGTGNNDGINDGAELPADAVSHDDAFAYTNFSAPLGSPAGFGGQRLSEPAHQTQPHGALEQQPHDILHDLVGGDGWMGDPNLAARDPIFWLHHANIDRLWQRWLDQGGRQNPTNDDAWMNTPFPFFNEKGQPVQMAAKDTLDTAGQLGYRYDDAPRPTVLARIRAAAPPPPPPPPPAHPAMLAATPEQKVELTAEPTTVTVGLKPAAHTALMQAIAPATRQRILLTLEGVRYDKNPGVYYEVYLNLPAGEKNPDPKGIYHVGNLSFFGLKTHAAPGHPAVAGQAAGGKAAFDITDAVRELKKQNAWNEKELRLTLVMRGLVPPRGKKARPKPGTRAEFSRVTITKE